MTTQQAKTIRDINAKDDAQRFQASQASREVAQMDVLSVWYAVQAKMEAGLVDEARAMVAAYRASQKGN